MTVSYEPVKSGKGGKVYGITFYVELNSGKDKKKLETKKRAKNLLLVKMKKFEMYVQVKELIKESVSIKDIKSICETAEYDFEKIQTAYHIAELAGHIENLVGFMIKAIKEGYATPVKKEKKNQFNNFEQRQYDFDEYEKVLLNRS